MFESFENGYKAEPPKPNDTLMVAPTPAPSKPAATPNTKPAAPAPATLMVEELPSERPPAESVFPSMNDDKPEPSVVVPGEIQDLRKQAIEEDPARRMYPPEKQITAISDTAFDSVESLTPQQRTEVVEEMRRIAADVSFGNADIQGLLSRASALQANPIPPEQQQAIAMRDLRLQFDGEKGAAKALADARALLNRDPRAKKILLALGLGDDSATIIRLAKQAARERARGRLK